jgi:hypothetical protein
MYESSINSPAGAAASLPPAGWAAGATGAAQAANTPPAVSMADVCKKRRREKGLFVTIAFLLKKL